MGILFLLMMLWAIVLGAWPLLISYFIGSIAKSRIRLEQQDRYRVVNKFAIIALSIGAFYYFLEHQSYPQGRNPMEAGGEKIFAEEMAFFTRVTLCCTALPGIASLLAWIFVSIPRIGNKQMSHEIPDKSEKDQTTREENRTSESKGDNAIASMVVIILAIIVCLAVLGPNLFV